MTKSIYQMLAELTSNTPSAHQSQFKSAAETGKTTHPTGKMDDGNSPVRTGSFLSEQNADVSAQQAQMIQKSGPISYNQEAAQNQTGIKKTEIGDDPAEERDFKTDNYDPGTTHPARVDKPQSDKMAVDRYKEASFADLYAGHTNLSNAILADIVMLETGSPVQKQAGAQAPQTGVNFDVLIKQAAGNATAEFGAGYQLAAQLGITKQAAEQEVAQYAQKLAHDAVSDAQLVIDYFQGLEQAKRAGEMELANEGSDKKEHSSQSAAGEGDDSAISDGAAVSDAQGASGGSADPGPDMDALAGAGNEQMPPEQAMAALEQALTALGIPPEELMQAIMAQQSGEGGDPAAMGGGDPAAMGGGMPPMGGDPAAMGGGMPPMDPAAMGGGDPAAMGGGMPPMEPAAAMKMACSLYHARVQRISGKQVKVSKALQTQMLNYVREVMR